MSMTCRIAISFNWSVERDVLTSLLFPSPEMQLAINLSTRVPGEGPWTLFPLETAQLRLEQQKVSLDSFNYIFGDQSKGERKFPFGECWSATLLSSRASSWTSPPDVGDSCRRFGRLQSQGWCLHRRSAYSWRPPTHLPPTFYFQPSTKSSSLSIALTSYSVFSSRVNLQTFNSVSHGDLKL